MGSMNWWEGLWPPRLLVAAVLLTGCGSVAPDDRDAAGEDAATPYFCVSLAWDAAVPVSSCVPDVPCCIAPGQCGVCFMPHDAGPEDAGSDVCWPAMQDCSDADAGTNPLQHCFDTDAACLPFDAGCAPVKPVCQ